MKTEKTNNAEKGKSEKGFKIFMAALIVFVIGFSAWLIWYINAEPTVKLCDYKNLNVQISGNDTATGSAAIPDGMLVGSSEDEKTSQAVLNALVENSKFYHLNKTVDQRYEQFIVYYQRIVALYDEYSTIEELATGYYGYDSYEAFTKDVRSYSELSVKQEMVLNAIAEKEGFTVTDDIFNKYIKKYLAAYDYGEDEIDAFLENYGKADVYQVILNDYTLDRVVEWAGL
ncbi:MAG: hypothetical protein ACI39R_06770 [Lachnospiraceae bacterium]